MIDALEGSSQPVVMKKDKIAIVRHGSYDYRTMRLDHVGVRQMRSMGERLLALLGEDEW